MPKRKRLSASQKAQIVLEAMREEKSVAQIATENSIHPNQIHRWKRQALEEFAQLFEDDRKGERAREAKHEKTDQRTICRDWATERPVVLAEKKSGFKFE